MKYDVIIIGAGLGGLQCASILARRGLSVCVVEKEPQVGGCLQAYRRSGHTLDTGFHYVGGLSDGQPLNRIFAYFGLLDLPWQQLDTDAFDEVSMGGHSYFYANGYDRFAERLTADFPHQRQQIRQYTDLLRQVGDNIVSSLDPRQAEDVMSRSLFASSAFDYLRQTVSDPLLRQVLSGTSLKMELHPNLPLYTFAQINSSYIQSAWRLRGGGQQLADKLADHIRAMGGVIRTRTEAATLEEDESGLTAILTADGERLEAKWFVSDIHPAATMRLLSQSKLVRRIYRNRISNLANTMGMFTASCLMKPESVPMLNRNQYVYQSDDLWHLADRKPGDPVGGVLVSYQAGADGYATNIDLLTPMTWAEVEAWNGTQVMRRGDDYESLKQERAAQCIDLASKLIPGLKDSIEAVFTSTPLTYADYTATAQGAAYGIRKDYTNLMYTLLTPRTPAPNLLLTGQSLNLHGVLGVSMTSFITCSTLMGETISPF